MKKVFSILLLILGLGLAANAQGYQIKGVVEDALGPVIGATVLEQGTTTGTSTGLDGDFILVVSGPDAIVEVSCMGYASRTFKASELPASILLSEDSEYLDDVVVIGYGSQKKKEVTGSVASVKSEDFNAGVKTNPMGLLQGKVAGLNIIKTTSDPTSTGYNIQIRGFSTLDKGTGTSPLFIVDGVPVSNIDNISPDEIASMDVLKDGSAAAILLTRFYKAFEQLIGISFFLHQFRMPLHGQNETFFRKIEGLHEAVIRVRTDPCVRCHSVFIGDHRVETVDRIMILFQKII